MKTQLIKAIKWEVRIEGNERSIKLFDENDKEIDRNVKTYWEGVFSCDNNKLTSLAGAPSIVGGCFYCDNNKLTSLAGAPSIVGGGFYCYNNKLTSLAGAPSEVGGGFYCYNNQLTSLAGKPLEYQENREVVLDLISAKLLMKNMLFADGILSEIISSKNNVFKIRNYGSKEITYCIYRDGNFSHGKNFQEAKRDLIFKVSKRDVSEFKSWKIEEKRELSGLISAYRSITGACEQGVKEFCKRIDMNKTYSIKEVIELTNGNYGDKKFKGFFLEIIN